MNSEKNTIRDKIQGIPWWSSGQDSVLSLLRAWVQSLVWELRSHEPSGTAKKTKTKMKYMPMVLKNSLSNIKGCGKSSFHSSPPMPSPEIVSVFLCIRHIWATQI